MPAFDESKEWELEEFLREMREENPEFGFALIEKIAGLTPEDPRIVQMVASHQNIEIMGHSFGTLISDSNARELAAIHIDAATASVAPDRSHEVANRFCTRVANVLGAVFVAVDPPHAPIGATAMMDLPASLFFFMFTMAWVRLPVVRNDRSAD
jgi:hypothetical protein